MHTLQGGCCARGDRQNQVPIPKPLSPSPAALSPLPSPCPHPHVPVPTPKPLSPSPRPYPPSQAPVPIPKSCPHSQAPVPIPKPLSPLPSQAALAADPYVDEVLVGAAHDVVVGHGDGVHAASRCLQHMHTLQVPDVPDLRESQQRQDETLLQRGDPLQPFCCAQSQPGSPCAQITP